MALSVGFACAKAVVQDGWGETRPQLSGHGMTQRWRGEKLRVPYDNVFRRRLANVTGVESTVCGDWKQRTGTSPWTWNCKEWRASPFEELKRGPSKTDLFFFFHTHHRGFRWNLGLWSPLTAAIRWIWIIDPGRKHQLRETHTFCRLDPTMVNKHQPFMSFKDISMNFNLTFFVPVRNCFSIFFIFF